MTIMEGVKVPVASPRKSKTEMDLSLIIKPEIKVEEHLDVVTEVAKEILEEIEPEHTVVKSLKILNSSHFVVSSKKSNFETSLNFMIFNKYFSFYRSRILHQFSISSL